MFQSLGRRVNKDVAWAAILISASIQAQPSCSGPTVMFGLDRHVRAQPSCSGLTRTSLATRSALQCPMILDFARRRIFGSSPKLTRGGMATGQNDKRCRLGGVWMTAIPRHGADTTVRTVVRHRPIGIRTKFDARWICPVRHARARPEHPRPSEESLLRETCPYRLILGSSPRMTMTEGLCHCPGLTQWECGNVR